MDTTIVQADVMDWCKGYKGPKFHALLCDPPYELGFMGKKWDKSGIVFDPDTWAALSEHLHPGGFGMAFASSRGWHRLAVAIEDAGLRIHPSIFGWVFGSGFPKATRIDTQIDKAAGAEREPSGIMRHCGLHHRGGSDCYTDDGWKAENRNGDYVEDTIPATDLARAWEGHRYGLQSMKPALEPIIVFQKPYDGKPVESIVETGAGALNIDGARIGTEPGLQRPARQGKGISGGWAGYTQEPGKYGTEDGQGRWPANFYVDEEAAARLGEQSGELKSGKLSPSNNVKASSGWSGGSQPDRVKSLFEPNKGTAARFFFNVNRQIDESDPVMYQAKASRKERDAGLDHLPLQERPGTFDDDNYEWKKGGHVVAAPRRNAHPTVKPIDLTRWLATLLLPPAEYGPRRILVPFSGSGSEMIGAHLAGWEEIVGIEMDAEYVEIARARLEHWSKGEKQLGFDLCPRS